jgi:hypothetical protein
VFFAKTDCCGSGFKAGSRLEQLAMIELPACMIGDCRRPDATLRFLTVAAIKRLKITELV